MVHVPVLLKEVVDLLDPKPGEDYIDATLGGGGHTRAILARIAPNGRVMGIDWDEDSLVRFKNEIDFEGKERVIMVQGNFSHIEEYVKEHSFEVVAGILFDLGWSSAQLGSVEGLSFREEEEVLDMRFMGGDVSARDVVNAFEEEEIARIIYEYGEERYSRRIAKEIVESRKRGKIETVGDLVRIITRVTPRRYEGGRIHPATRTFQALRIYVNHELENLEQGLDAAIRIVKKGGRIVVISFHSLEDRIVKNFFRDKAKEDKVSILTKKPIQATWEEIRKNPRARSAKLRVAEII